MTIGEAALLRAAVLERLQELPVEAYRNLVTHNDDGDHRELECRVSLCQETGSTQRTLAHLSVIVRCVPPGETRPPGETIAIGVEVH